QRLKIMKDPHLGTFGLVGGGLLLLGKFAALSQLLKLPEPPAILIALAIFLARCLVLFVAAGARYPRNEGTGKILVEAVGGLEGAFYVLVGPALICVWVIGTAYLFGTWQPFWPEGLRIAVENCMLVVAFCLPAFLAVVLVRYVCESRLGGITGDCL